jgi:stage V sporulation protein K
MSRLSIVAETLHDYTISIAKRNENEVASGPHLLAAIRRWREQKFDQDFPGLGERVDSHLRELHGSFDSRPTIEPKILDLLVSVNNEGDVWSLIDRLVDGLPQVGERSHAGVAAETSLSNDRKSERQVDLTESLPLLLNGELVDRAATELGEDVSIVRSKAAGTAIKVAEFVIGALPLSATNEIAKAVDFDGGEFEHVDDISSLVREIVNCATETSSRLATQLALALVDVGEWAAALDDNVTESETNKIDEVRLVLRAVLGVHINAESEAMIEFESKFADLVGMESVKDDLRKRVDFLMVNQKRKKRGRNVENHRLHMAFLGNPGTGKTTVARLYGHLLRQVGLLPKDAFHETDRSGLVGEYIGHSEKKTLEAIEKADGGVLFIDEAYALDDRYSSGHKGFGAEATDVLVKQMEDRRDRLVVIVAGYSAPMEGFLAMNLGLRSRIPVHLTFPDYSDDELVEIAERIAARRGLKLASDVRAKIKSVLAVERTQEGFGNAREVENLLDAAQRNVVARISGLGNLATEAESSTIKAEDIPVATEPVAKRPIGFARSTYL